MLEDILMGVRQEEEDDIVDVQLLLEAAFGHEDESRLVAKLRSRPTFDPYLSFVAFQGRRILGHLLFTPIWIVEDEARDIKHEALVLAPVAVLPEEQRKGLGTSLIKYGLLICKQHDHGIVIVVGHPEYYERFGFRAAGAMGITNDLGVKDPYFMVLELEEGALEGVTGEVGYPQPFKEM